MRSNFDIDIMSVKIHDHWSVARINSLYFLFYISSSFQKSIKPIAVFLSRTFVFSIILERFPIKNEFEYIQTYYF